MIVPAQLDWSSIDTVLLDMDGTLLDLHFDSHFWLEHLPKRYAELHQADPDETRLWLHERIMQEVGTLNWYCLDYWSEELGIDIVEIKREVVERIGYRPHVQTFLTAVRRAGKRAVIVTNAHHDSLNLKLETTDLAQRVDRIICSHDFGVPKEEQAFWHTLQTLEPFDPKRTVLFDDSLAVLRSAKTYGIAHLISIIQPDSQQPEREIDEFMSLHSFNDVLPEETE